MLTALPSWLIASPVQSAVKSRLRESERYEVMFRTICCAT